MQKKFSEKEVKEIDSLRNEKESLVDENNILKLKLEKLTEDKPTTAVSKTKKTPADKELKAVAGTF